MQREDEATVYVVGVSRNVDENEIMEMSSSPQLQNETFWLVPQFSDLANKHIINSILTQICGDEQEKSKYYGNINGKQHNEFKTTNVINGVNSHSFIFTLNCKHEASESDTTTFSI